MKYLKEILGEAVTILLFIVGFDIFHTYLHLAVREWYHNILAGLGIMLSLAAMRRVFKELYEQQEAG